MNKTPYIDERTNAQAQRVERQKKRRIQHF